MQNPSSFTYTLYFSILNNTILRKLHMVVTTTRTASSPVVVLMLTQIHIFVHPPGPGVVPPDYHSGVSPLRKTQPPSQRYSLHDQMNHHFAVGISVSNHFAIIIILRMQPPIRVFGARLLPPLQHLRPRASNPLRSPAAGGSRALAALTGRLVSLRMRTFVYQMICGTATPARLRRLLALFFFASCGSHESVGLRLLPRRPQLRPFHPVVHHLHLRP
mmetsp:Transcript_30923/g.45345  ORF Transcript_30923/g.45345 Transcript_30923/m.45345 type:complete len:217 (-) Transcript_30923:999-1649(-)